MIYRTIRQMNKLLDQLDGWLVKATDFAQKKAFDPNTFLEFRLAPDQYPFVRQVQLACDHAKFGAARLAGKEAPSHPDNEKTIDALRERIRAVRSWLDGFKESDFSGAEKRVVSLPKWEGRFMVGEDYLQEQTIPNFYFHLTHSYAILRHNGLELGKKDYVGALSLRSS